MLVKFIKNVFASLDTRDARHHMGIAMALITVIPSLSLAVLAMTEEATLIGPFTRWHFAGAASVLSIAMGYYLLSRYPINIIRLRTYLQNMVNGRIPDKVELIKGMGDIPAIENAMNMLVEQLSRQVSRMQDELQRIEWLISRHVTSPFHALARESRRGAVSSEHRTCRFVTDAVGEETLHDIVGDLMDLMETTAFCFEANGDVACYFTVSAWSRVIEQAESVKGKNQCLRALWEQGGRSCMETGLTQDMECPSGTRAFITPLEAGGRVVGVVGFTYGDPPELMQDLRTISAQTGIAVESLQQAARAYERRPPFIVNVARNRLLTASRLIGQMIERRQTEENLRKSEDALRRHQANLENIVAERTAELTHTNDLLQMEIEERRKAERLKDEFVATVSHELRTPLAITKEGISLLLDAVPGPITPKQTKVLTTAQINIDRLARIINDLLDISKIEAGKMVVRREPVDLCTLIHNAVASLEPLAAQRGITLAEDLPPSPVTIFADPDRIMQVLTNLLSNALKFTKQGGVCVILKVINNTVECAVRDTGVGIAPEDIPKLFQKFIQLHRVEGPGQRGTGLGLTIAKNIIELHRGRMWAESKPGEGTTFTFSLELHLPESSLRDTITERIDLARASHQEMVMLLVELPKAMSRDVISADAYRRLVRQIEKAGITRAEDHMSFRGEQQIVIMTACEEGLGRTIQARWLERLESALGSESGPAAAVKRSFAIFPTDGLDAAELLEKVEKALDGGDSTELASAQR